MTKNNNKSNYGAEAITVLEGLEPVRKRPGMYIGSTSSVGLHHLIWEVADNSFDEAMAGHCNEIEVKLLENNMVSVTDNGRGIPVDIHKKTGVSALETVLTKLHAGGKFGEEDGGYKVSGGLHGVGVSVVNALSTYLKAEVHRDKKISVQEYEIGKPKGKIKTIGKTDKTGTTITFQPDPTIFKETTEFNWDYIIKHFRQQTYLTKKIKLEISDLREKEEKKHYSFYFEGGIKSYVKILNRGKNIKNKNIFYIDKEIEDSRIEIALQYNDEFNENVLPFANNIHNPEGGTHIAGFRSALTRTLNNYARKNKLLKEKEDNLTGEDVREGLTAIVSVKLTEPQFEGQTKGKLGNTEIKTYVEQIFGEFFNYFLEENPKDAEAIIGKCILSAQARIAARTARATILRKNALDGMTLPGKLADCSSRKAEECEIFIVEGDSAGGSAKQGRNRKFQAILPIFGKMLNVEKTRIDKVLKNEKLQPLIIALGTGIDDTFDISKLRYYRIILMADADVDGSHIRTLMLTFLYKYYKDLIINGHIYIAQPPLYKIQKGNISKYAYTEKEREGIIKIMGGEIAEENDDIKEENEKDKKNKNYKKIKIQRYKGLGEMNPEQLWETTMNPETRILKQVTIEDASNSEKIFDMLMGSEVAPRKHFIQTHAKNVTNLDI